MFTFLKSFLKISRIVLLILFISLIFLSYYLYTIYNKKTGGDINLTLTAPETGAPPGLVKAPTPYLLLPQGKQEFQIRSGQTNGPTGTKIVADPLDVPVGSNQTVTLDIKSPVTVDSVSANVITDNGQKVYPMDLSSGSGLDGSWAGTWTMEDTHEVVFTIEFIVNYGSLTSKILFPIR